MPAITLQITKNSNAWTNMRIYRGAVKETVYNGAPLADVVAAASYIDETAVSGELYYYGVEMYNGTDKTQFTPIRAVTIADFGPLAAAVQSNIAITGNQCIQGDSNLGVIQRATLAQFPSVPGLPNTKARMEEIWLAATGVARAQPATDPAMVVALLEGKMVVLPTVPNTTWGTAVVVNTAIADMIKIRDYLVNNPSKALIDIGGYRWKIKFLTKELLMRNPDIVASFVAGSGYVRRIAQVLPIDVNTIVYSEADASAWGPTSTATGASYVLSSGTRTFNLMMYFEYVGATPLA